MNEKSAAAKVNTRPAKRQENSEAAVAESVRDPDVALMLRFQRGEQQCFDELYHKYKRQLLAFAYRMTGRAGRSEELVQEIFIRCCRSAPTYRPDAKFSTWIYHIARNCCRNELRRPEYRHRAETFDDHAGAALVSTPEMQAANRQRIRLAQEALAAVPERQRTALVLSRFHQMSYEEIAETMDTSVSAVKSLLIRAKERMVEVLRAQGGTHDL